MNFIFLVACFAMQISVGGSFTLNCGSPSADSCRGLPIECRVNLNPELCSGEDIFEDNVEVTLIVSDGSINPPFTTMQLDSLLILVVDYVPGPNISSITIQVSMLSSNCSFTATHYINIKECPIFHPWVIRWSNVETTDAEKPGSSNYVTIGEQFNMTIMACMPESTTGIHLFVTIPHEDSVPLVSVNDAYVTFIGSELYNTTLMEGDGE